MLTKSQIINTGTTINLNDSYVISIIIIYKFRLLLIVLFLNYNLIYLEFDLSE